MERRGKLEALGGWIAMAAFTVFSAMVADTALAATSITASKHNLGSGGPGPVNTTSTTEVCVFCHTPHGGDTAKSAPLWNRGAGAATYFVYDGLWGDRPSSFDGGQDSDGKALTVGSISALCLSCHDGATALDLLINKPGSGANTATTYTFTDTIGSLNGMTNIGGDLKNDHPIGVAYCGGKKPSSTGNATDVATNCKDADFNNASSSGGLFWVDTTGGTAAREKTDMILYVRNFGTTTGNWPAVECGSCHDPHNADSFEANKSVAFLRIKNDNSQLCLTCHKK